MFFFVFYGRKIGSFKFYLFMDSISFLQVSRGNSSPPQRRDDREGHFIFVPGENLTPRCEYDDK